MSKEIIKHKDEWTPEEFQKYTEVKSTGEIRYTDTEGQEAVEVLSWSKEDIGFVEIVDGVKTYSVKKIERAHSQVLGINFIRDRIEQQQSDLTTIDLREIV